VDIESNFIEFMSISENLYGIHWVSSVDSCVVLLNLLMYGLIFYIYSIFNQSNFKICTIVTSWLLHWIRLVI